MDPIGAGGADSPGQSDPGADRHRQRRPRSIYRGRRSSGEAGGRRTGNSAVTSARHMATETTRTREVRGVQIFERRVGQGSPVVVLHGGPGAHHDYLLPGFDVLAHGRELIYYDQRGGGRSPVDRDIPVGWREHVADLEELREQWGLSRLTLAGYSWGGLLGLLYAVEFPARIERLALVSPAPAWRAARLEFEKLFQERN